MTRVLDRKKVIELRLQGKTYSEILREVQISKSTLSDWLRNYPLTADQMRILRLSQQRNKDLSVEKIRITKQLKRELRLKNTYKEQQDKYFPLSQKELEIAGLFLYLGEGNKSLKSALSIANTDIKVIRFALYWYMYGLGVPKDKIRVLLHLYSDMDIQKEMNYWSQKLRIPQVQFCKPYIKTSTRAAITHKGFGHGTCNITVQDTRLKEKIIMGINAITDLYDNDIISHI